MTRLLVCLISIAALAIFLYAFESRIHVDQIPVESSTEYSSKPHKMEKTFNNNVKSEYLNYKPLYATDINNHKYDLFNSQEKIDEKIVVKEKNYCLQTPWVKRYFLVKPNIEAMAIGKPLVVNLFNDLKLIAIIVSKQKASGVSTNTVLRGHIDGIKQSDITMVTTCDGILIGDIRIYSKALYEIRYVGDGIHSVREIDETKLPSCQSCPLNTNDSGVRK